MSGAEAGRPLPKAGAPEMATEQDTGAAVIIREALGLLGTSGAWVVMKEFRVRAPQGEPGKSPGAPHVLLGYPLESRIDARHAPGTPEGFSSVEERVGTLAKFVARLAKNGTLRKGYSLKAPADARIVQKCAHIAQGLGISLGYEFSLLENGAFSSDLEMDLCRLEIGRGGTDPFAENEATTVAFERLVAGRETEWLEAATFALHPKSKWRTGDEFAKRRGMIEYDGRTARDAFGRVAACLRDLGART